MPHYDEIRCVACGYTQEQETRLRMPKAAKDVMDRDIPINEKAIRMVRLGVNEYWIAELLGVSITQVKEWFTEDRYARIRVMYARGMTKLKIAIALDVSRGTVDRAIGHVPKRRGPYRKKETAG